MIKKLEEVLQHKLQHNYFVVMLTWRFRNFDNLIYSLWWFHAHPICLPKFHCQLRTRSRKPYEVLSVH